MAAEGATGRKEGSKQASTLIFCIFSPSWHLPLLLEGRESQSSGTLKQGKCVLALKKQVHTAYSYIISLARNLTRSPCISKILASRLASYMSWLSDKMIRLRAKQEVMLICANAIKVRISYYVNSRLKGNGSIILCKSQCRSGSQWLLIS